MNKAVASVLKNKLKTVPYLELVAGLVRVQETTDMRYDDNTGASSPVVYRYPVSDDVHSSKDCPLINGLVDCSPNTDYAGIVYFEDQGTSVPTRQGAWLNFSSQLRLVCWLNSKQFQQQGPDLPARVMADIIGKLTGNPFNEGVLTKVKVSVRNVPQTGKTLFASYTFNEATSQYLMPPFEAFALDLTVEFSISTSCEPNLLTDTPSC